MNDCYKAFSNFLVRKIELFRINYFFWVVIGRVNKNFIDLDLIVIKFIEFYVFQT